MDLVTEICQSCQGSGETYYNFEYEGGEMVETEPCDKCNGLGEIQKIESRDFSRLY